VQQTLSEHLVVLVSDLEGNHDSENAYLNHGREAQIERLLLSLRIPVPPARPKDDETETTSLVRALLALSGGKADLRHNMFFAESTITRNAELFASLLNVTMTKEFGNVDVQEMIKMVSKSPVFSGTMVDEQGLHDRILNMKRSLHLGFDKDYLVRHLNNVT
jgi:hypothetical protein